ncbi:HEPN domain-containing protein [Paenibacillus sp. 11B]|uniref:HEPN domain-containing protein n=1 Tax=unclassified Paenibacillus TaxID=185978 RepID=UPI00264E983F|nr:HEPN domain-containing protein [Paenibacillus sp. 11B]MDN8592045.1 HEPN domain-containing protein [Paenibacillus sp. 11B]
MFDDKKLIDINSIDGFQEYLELLSNDDYFKIFFSYRGFFDNDIYLLGVRLLVTKLIEAYLHIYGTNSELKVENFNKLYEPIEEFIFAERLYYDIYVPILFTKFDFEDCAVSESGDIEIVKIDDNLQLSRSSIQQHGSPISSSILNGASHALKIKGFSIEGKRSYFDVNQHFSDISMYPIDKINAFFNSMRIITFDNDLGYAQLLAVPVGWTEKYNAFLSSIYGTTVKSYPKVFEDYFWLKTEFTTINEDLAKDILNLFERFDLEKQHKLQLANRRLNMCVLREEEEDSILDATIAMEALLSDGGTGELTHKLALRMATIFKISPLTSYTPDMVFDIVKKIYAYRSSIVHGGKVKNQEITLQELGLTIPTPRLAIVLLKITIKVLIDNPIYFNPKLLDLELLKVTETPENIID